MKDNPLRETINLNKNWYFAYGHATDPDKDFHFGTEHFSCYAKAGWGGGAVSDIFDCRSWRSLDLPHDWCVELLFDDRGRKSHGTKAIGRAFPQNSVGWYRKYFHIPEEDPGKRISLRFEGIFRASIVWVNGFYLGTENSGYYGFSYEISEYLNYGQDNLIVVRVDASGTEGWYYEGAGIYRDVSLLKIPQLHLEQEHTFIRSTIAENQAELFIQTGVKNCLKKTIPYEIRHTIISPAGEEVLETQVFRNDAAADAAADAGIRMDCTAQLPSPELWSIEHPALYILRTELLLDGTVHDRLHTKFGIRSIHIDPDQGFFLNGTHLKLKGSNLHQDHAGTGIAVPDGLWEYKIRQLKKMGSNAIRTAHHPPSPGMLDVCDRLGMLVMVENRLMGINREHLDLLKRMICRDRNHPSVFIWSLGNEEWGIEGNEKGKRITGIMMNYARKLDPSRPYTVGLSGGWDQGIGEVSDAIGYNYIFHGDIDDHHRKFPNQGGMGTEETTTHQTRGIYLDDPARDHLAPAVRDIKVGGTEFGWQFYAKRPFLAGIFYWTGFDYRGESNPAGTAVMNQSGILDLCGYFKDWAHYLKSWWSKEPHLHIAAHWNSIKGYDKTRLVNVFSNCDEVELFLNKMSLGKKVIPENGHLSWEVTYRPGTLEAAGFKNGSLVLKETIHTVGAPDRLALVPEKMEHEANDSTYITVITVKVLDAAGRFQPVAEENLVFSISGNGRIIGVGNGDPSSREDECVFAYTETIDITGLKELIVDSLENRPEIAADFDDSAWPLAFISQGKDGEQNSDPLIVVRGSFELPEIPVHAAVTLYSRSITGNQSIYVNGILLADKVKQDSAGQAFPLSPECLKKGKNSFVVTGKRLRKSYFLNGMKESPGNIGIQYPDPVWKRKTFNGLAQIIIKSDKNGGAFRFKASGNGLPESEITVDI